jgi:uncharacterized membrane protein SirB2
MEAMMNSPSTELNLQDARRTAELRAARAHVKNLRSFYLSVCIAAGVLSVIWLVNAMSYKTYAGWWAVWPTLVWGISLLFSGLSLMAEKHGWLFGPQWEERKVRQLMNGK